jgi:hypothetical protein
MSQKGLIGRRRKHLTGRLTPKPTSPQCRASLSACICAYSELETHHGMWGLLPESETLTDQSNKAYGWLSERGLKARLLLFLSFRPSRGASWPSQASFSSPAQGTSFVKMILWSPSR